MTEKKSDIKKYNPNASGGFLQFLWNPETKEFLGRTGLSWLKIIVFYIIFYAGLSAFFGFCLYIFHLTLNDNSPKWTLSESLIGTNPGMGYRPTPDQDVNPGSTLIWYQRENDADARFWYSQIENFVSEYENVGGSESLITCSYNDSTQASMDTSCRVDLNDFGSSCTKSNKYGYGLGEPCILLKLNKVYNWEPEGFGIRNGEYSDDILQRDLNNQVDEHQMPIPLRNHILREVLSTHKDHPVKFLSTVWISCEGENPGDKENLGSVEFFPQQGIPGYYFPYLRQPGYQPPFVFLKLVRPYNKVLINIECKAWARNIHPDRQQRVGSVHFEIMID